MKRNTSRLLSLLLALYLALALLPGTVWATDQDVSDIDPADQRAYEAMIALKSDYPEGMTWTNDDYYAWNGGINRGGYGCVAFAFMLSDAAFGSLPARRLASFEFSDIRVGDILRIKFETK